jgi:hypothetical protein
MQDLRNEKIKESLGNVVEAFKKGDVPQAIKIVMFPRSEMPSNKWSLCNKLIMYFNGTEDARGLRQWNKEGRWIKKGSKAFYILGPKMVNVKEEDGTEKTVLKGFISIPVFKLEDTEGKPLNKPDLNLPNLRLLNVAERWGIEVKPVEGNDFYNGYFMPGQNKIRLATPEENVFFHELAHAGHNKILNESGKKLNGGQDPKQEITAELTASVLSEYFGISSTMGNNYDYIKSYADQQNKSVELALMEVLTDVEKILNLIMEENFNF